MSRSKETMPTDRQNEVAIIWGINKRSEQKFPLMPIEGKPLIQKVFNALNLRQIKRIGLIVTSQLYYEFEKVVDAKVDWLVQENPLDFGQAILQAEDWLKGFKGNVILLTANMPFVTKQLIMQLIQCQPSGSSVGCLLTAKAKNPGHLNRVVRDSEGRIIRLLPFDSPSVIDKDKNEVTGFPYCFEWDCLQRALYQVCNEKDEHPLTEVIEKVTDNGFDVTSLAVQNTLPFFRIRSLHDLRFVQQFKKKKRKLND